MVQARVHDPVVAPVALHVEIASDSASVAVKVPVCAAKVSLPPVSAREMVTPLTIGRSFTPVIDTVSVAETV